MAGGESIAFILDGSCGQFWFDLIEIYGMQRNI